MMKFNFALILLICLGTKLFAQQNLNLYVMPDAQLKLRVTEKYAQSYGIESRNFIFKDETWSWKAKHIELAHLSSYALSATKSVGLGVQYRFESSKAKENELRLLQQYEWKKTKDAILKQRIRSEQRLYASVQKYRFRYKAGLALPMRKFAKSLAIENEALLEVSTLQKPEYEYRLSILPTWKLSKQSDFSFGPHYRLSDFTQDVSHNIFLIAGLKVQM